MDKELIMYNRSYGCPYSTLAKLVFSKENVAYREIFIDKDSEAQARVLDWTGFRVVPTLVVAQAGDLVPFEPPQPLATGKSPRGIDRGSMISEPDDKQLLAWLAKHGFVET